MSGETRIYHRQVGAGRRTVGRRSGAGPGRTGRRRVVSPKKQPPPLPPKVSRASKTTVLINSPEAWAIEIACICRIQNPDIPRAGRVWAAHGGAEGGSGPGRTGRRPVCSPTNQPPLSPPRASYKTVQGIVPKCRSIESNHLTVPKLVESKTRTHHGPVGSGRRTAGRRGGAGLGRTGRRWVDPARRQPALPPPSES